MAEYINMITVSAVVSTVFLGGWGFFGLERFPVVSILVFLVKVSFFLFLFIWLRATLPRIRYDRLMRLGWQTLLPLAVLNVVITAICVTFNLPWWVSFIVGIAIIAGVLLYERRAIKVSSKAVERQGVTGPSQEAILPTSVRLAKFEPVKTETKAASLN
jgi:NADH-quinone oxidoreductase subunit H